MSLNIGVIFFEVSFLKVNYHKEEVVIKLSR